MIDVRTNEKLLIHFQKLLIQEKRRIERFLHVPLPSDLQRTEFLEKTVEILELHKKQSPDHPRRLSHKFVGDWRGQIVGSMGTVVKCISWRTTGEPIFPNPAFYINRMWKGFAIPQRDKVTKVCIKVDKWTGHQGKPTIYHWCVTFGY